MSFDVEASGPIDTRSKPKHAARIFKTGPHGQLFVDDGTSRMRSAWSIVFRDRCQDERGIREGALEVASRGCRVGASGAEENISDIGNISTRQKKMNRTRGNVLLKGETRA